MGTRGHWDPILAPGSARGWQGQVLGWGAVPGWGQCQDKDKDTDTNDAGRAGPDKQGCISHTYINTVRGHKRLWGGGSAVRQRVPRRSCPWDPSWTMFRPPREGAGVVPP